MTHQEILEKAIQEAINGGWLPYFAQFDTNMTKDNILIRYHEGSSSVNFDYEMPGHIVGVGGYSLEPYSIIFSHDFAKALWNAPMMWENDLTQPSFETRDGLSEWQYHLQQMVISPDPIQYLADNLPD